MSVLHTGVEAIAVASAILQGDVEENARRFIDHLKE
jgi:thiamine monophosphate synthase